MDQFARRAANSAPSGRDYGAEIDDLLSQAEGLRKEAEAIDFDAAATECLEKGRMYFSTAHELGEQNAARASEKARQYTV